MEDLTGAVSSMTLDNREFTQAHRYVLFNSENIYQFHEMHKSVVEDELQRDHRRISPAIIHKHHMEKSCGWFRSHLLDTGMGKKKRQLPLVYVGKGSSHGRQRMEAQDEEAHGQQRVEKRYLIDHNIVKPLVQMGWAMHILRVLKRNQRTKLKKDHIKLRMTKEEVLAKPTPPRVMEDQWREMVNYWFHEKTVVLLLYSSISF
nr:hypothetical protein CFP56_43349 [Quercus suber]